MLRRVSLHGLKSYLFHLDESLASGDVDGSNRSLPGNHSAGSLLIFFQGRRILQACQKWTVLTTWLPGGLLFWSLLHSAECRSDTDALEPLVELITIYFSRFFPLAEHGFYTISYMCVCSKFIIRFTKVWAGSDVLDGPSLFESWHSPCHLLLPPVIDQTSQTYF